MRKGFIYKGRLIQEILKMNLDYSERELAKTRKEVLYEIYTKNKEDVNELELYKAFYESLQLVDASEFVYARYEENCYISNEESMKIFGKIEKLKKEKREQN